MPTALVTGSARGIGADIAATLLRGEWCVYGLSRSSERQQAFREHLAPAAQAKFYPFIGSVTAQDDVDRVVAAAAGRGPLDAVIINSGIEGPTTPVELLEIDELLEVLDVNLVGALRTAKAAIPQLRRSIRGRIVFISSTTAKRAVAGRAAYAASKAGMAAAARVLASELGPANITVNTVSPGVVRGPRWDRVASALARANATTTSAVTMEYEQMAALGKLVEPRDVSTLVEFLLSEAAGAVTGQDINVCAGLLTDSR